MTRWGMVADLRRCVGCQTCTASCRHTNATSPAVQWRKVLDMEVGEYPDVRRAFVPVGCMHCADPPCMHVCPSTATKQRPDGIVTIDYDLCIGCAYCMVACPYQARYKVTEQAAAYGKAGRMKHESQREDPDRLGVAQKCTFCSDRIDYGLANDLTPGIDPAATPACVNSCIADALHFGDLENSESNVSSMLRENKHFVMHDELATGSGFHYLWESADDDGDGDDDNVLTFEDAKHEIDRRMTAGSDAVGPKRQTFWDWRAAGNFIAGGTGSGLFVAASAIGYAGAPFQPFGLLALAFVGLGLFLVWLETGRPWRAPLNVFFNPQTSWMTRESMVASLLFPIGLAALWFDVETLTMIAGLVAFAFLYCQGRILLASKGIPIWRQLNMLPLILTTGLAEGLGMYLIASRLLDPWFTPVGVGHALWGLALAATARTIVWTAYRNALEDDAPTESKKILAKIHPEITLIGLGLPIAAIVIVETIPAVGHSHLGTIAAVAGLGAAIAGWYMKFVIITRAAYDQGYAILRTPERGTGGGGSGFKPGWS
jgi:Fe-S-cluster-containing dehydrogenase component